MRTESNPNEMEFLGQRPKMTAYKGQADKNRLSEYSKAMATIKEATGVSDINEVIQKFATQAETLGNLQDIKAKNEKKLL